TIPVEYRLIPDAPYPAAVYDLKDAVRWVHENAERYGIDTARIAISGCSAGGQLAHLVGTTNGDGSYEYVRRYFHVTSDVQAVINIDGISDFITPETVGRAQEARDRNLTPPVDMQWLGGTFAERPDNWRAASPVYHVGPRSAPVCYINSSLERFHQGRDEQIALMDRYGIYSEVHTLDDTPHTFWLFHPWFGTTVDIMDDFLRKVL
ncbi:MAG: alpha/beta hydrolase, partial [Alistipes sp.]|nr:alpha/beta hydrolase [Alistipes sp.]